MAGRPYRPVTASIGHALKATQHLLRQRMDRKLRDIGLTTPQYAVLSALEDAPGLSSAALARRCFVTPQTMTGIVAKLKSAGLIARLPDPDHGRIIQTRLTEEGQRRLGQAHRAVDQVEAEMTAGLRLDQRATLASLLTACVGALERAGE